MSCATSEGPGSAGAGNRVWTGCQHCSNRKDCPYLRDREREKAAHAAARQERDQARLLTAESEQLLAAIDCAEDVGSLLKANERLERVLSQVLRAELAAVDGLSACPGEPCSH